MAPATRRPGPALIAGLWLVLGVAGSAVVGEVVGRLAELGAVVGRGGRGGLGREVGHLLDEHRPLHAGLGAALLREAGGDALQALAGARRLRPAGGRGLGVGAVARASPVRPKAARRPAVSASRCVVWRAARVRSWIAATTSLPRAARSASRPTVSRAWRGSRPDIGSSAIRISGSPIRARASMARASSPPESVVAGCRRWAVRSQASIA